MKQTKERKVSGERKKHHTRRRNPRCWREIRLSAGRWKQVELMVVVGWGGENKLKRFMVIQHFKEWNDLEAKKKKKQELRAKGDEIRKQKNTPQNHIMLKSSHSYLNVFMNDEENPGMEASLCGLSHSSSVL